MEYEPDGDMIFNYLMVSALAAATDFIEKEGLKPSGGKKLFKMKYYRVNYLIHFTPLSVRSLSNIDYYNCLISV